MKTLLAEDMDGIGQSRQYDEVCKRLLSHKEVLARILLHCVDEYKECSVQEIRDTYIEGEAEIGSVPIRGGQSARIQGDNTEDTSLGEGMVRYDIRFHAVAPGSGGKEKEWIGLIINIEAQNRYHQTYPLTKRGIYYCSRLLSAQYGVEFQNSHYEKLKKVYSIWICVSPPGEVQNSITEYGIYENVICGNARQDKQNYDLMKMIMLCLGDERDTEQEVLRFLDVLFSDNISIQVKKQVLETEFALEMSDRMEGDLDTMCNLSEGVFYRGYEEGGFQNLLENLQNMMEGLGLSLEQAAAVLKLSDERLRMCQAALEKKRS